MSELFQSKEVSIPIQVQAKGMLASPLIMDREKKYPLVVGLHPYGSTPESFSKIVTKLGVQDFLFLFPRGPFPFKTKTGKGYSWMVSNAGEHDEEGRDYCEALILRFIDDVAQRFPVDAARIYLYGFSQGSFLAWYLGIKYPRRFAGTIAVGSWLNLDVVQPILPRAKGFPFLIQHGKDDDMVTPDRGRQVFEALKMAKARATYKTYATGHQVTPAMIQDARSWLLTGKLPEAAPPPEARANT